MEEVYFDKEGREKLLTGINKLSRAVASTMGPKGKTVIIPDKNKYGEYMATKDGVSVANAIELKDRVENIGASMIRKAAQKTVDDAGDGTTTATVLATAFVNNLKDFSSYEVNRAFDIIIPEVIEQLKQNSRKLERGDIKHVASISANNDIQIGDIIQQAYNHTDIVKVEDSTNTEDKLELIDGMALNVSYFSKHFVTNQKKGECVLNEPNVLIFNGKIEKLDSYSGMIQDIANKNESLLIICDDIHAQPLRKLESLCLSNDFKVCVIKSPGFSQHRKDLLQDIAHFTGTKVHTDPKTIHIGKLQSCKISKNQSILIKHPSIDVSLQISDLEEILKLDSYTEHDKRLIRERLENLKGKVSIIRVGGGSELEMKERFDRYDDAVKAVKCALEEGVIEGGGIALMSQAMSIMDKSGHLPIIYNIGMSLSSPHKTIVYNGAEFDYCKTFEQNIIDPLKVTRCALENAVSVAKVILSTEAIVLSKEEWN